MFVAACTGAAAAALGVAMAHSTPAMIVALILAVALLAAVRSVSLAAAVEYAGRREATTLGFVFALMDGVGAAGAVMAGIAGQFDLVYAFILAAVLALAAAGIATLCSFRVDAAELAPAAGH